MADRRDWEAAISLAMLPIGLGLGIVSALAAAGLMVAALIYSVLAIVFHPAMAWLAVVGWFWVGGAAMAWCTLHAIEAVGGLSWREGARVAAVWGLVVLVYPGFWLAA